MNRMGQHLLQTAIPAALGYAAGRYYSSAAKNNNVPQQNGKFDDGILVVDSAPRARSNANELDPIRGSSRGSSRGVVAPDYPSKDFLPFVVPHIDYANILKRFGGDASSSEAGVDVCRFNDNEVSRGRAPENCTGADK